MQDLYAGAREVCAYVALVQGALPFLLASFYSFSRYFFFRAQGKHEQQHGAVRAAA